GSEDQPRRPSGRLKPAAAPDRGRTLPRRAVSLPRPRGEPYCHPGPHRRPGPPPRRRRPPLGAAEHEGVLVQSLSAAMLMKRPGSAGVLARFGAIILVCGGAARSEAQTALPHITAIAPSGG